MYEETSLFEKYWYISLSKWSENTAGISTVCIRNTVWAEIFRLSCQRQKLQSPLSRFKVVVVCLSIYWKGWRTEILKGVTCLCRPDQEAVLDITYGREVMYVASETFCTVANVLPEKFTDKDGNNQKLCIVPAFYCTMGKIYDVRYFPEDATLDIERLLKPKENNIGFQKISSPSSPSDSSSFTILSNQDRRNILVKVEPLVPYRNKQSISSRSWKLISVIKLYPILVVRRKESILKFRAEHTQVWCYVIWWALCWYRHIYLNWGTLVW